MDKSLFTSNLKLVPSIIERLKVFIRICYYYCKRIFILFNLFELIKLKNSCKNKSIFLFGNGPSINLINPDKINHYINNENFDFCAVNMFYNTNQKMHLIID